MVDHIDTTGAERPTPFTSRHATVFAAAVLAVTVIGVVASAATVPVLGDLPAGQGDEVVANLFVCIPYGLAGAVLIARRPDLPFGWLLAAAATALTVSLVTLVPALVAIGHGTGGWPVRLGLLGGNLLFVPVALQGLVNVRFPSGRPASRWGTLLERLIVGGLVVVVVAGAFGRWPAQLPGDVDAGLRRPLAGEGVAAVADAMMVVAPLVVLLGLVAGLRVVVRCLRATGLERQQLKWRAAGVVVAFALFPLAVTGRLGPTLSWLDGVLFVATLAVPVLRYRLWAIDTIIRRSALYAAVTVVLVGLYALVTAVAAGMAPERVGTSVAAVAVALAVLPVRALAQHTVDRLFYGQRRDPYRALADVGRRLESAAAPGEVLPAVVAAVAGSLRLPYVAIERPGDGEVLAAGGEAGLASSGRVERWDLRYEGTTVGVLAASPRRGEPAFDRRDRQVLADIAHHAGPAVRAATLTRDLLEARQRLVSAREEERRRLRRDLHDGLGPTLTGLGLMLDAARAGLSGPASAEASVQASVDKHLALAREATGQVLADVRGMAFELRPPALDDLGLRGALDVAVGRIVAGSELTLRMDVEDLPPLPAAVEVAVYRAVLEAVTNAARHGSGSRCSVRLAVQDSVQDPVQDPVQNSMQNSMHGSALLLEVTDDGRAGPAWRPGVGLTAMRERAEELGGDVQAGPATGGSTGGVVRARYPLSLVPAEAVGS